jgi:MacB-like periplasmic core domain/FtsX-like permease family
VPHAIRLLKRQPGFSTFAILTLGLGIGAATAVFTLVQSVLLHQLPFADPDRLVWMYNARTERDRAPFSIPDLNDYARDVTTLAGLAPFTNWTANLTGAFEAERLEGTRVGGTFFELLGTHAALGRTLAASDEASAARVAVLTHGLWMRRFGANPAVVGTTVILNGAQYTVVGVMPPGFVFPFRDAEIAVPLLLRDDPRRTDRGANFLRVVARLKSGASLAQAKADLDATARRLQRQFPDDDARKTGVSLYPLQAEIVSDYRQILWTLFAAVGVLLAIGCGNLANLTARMYWVIRTHADPRSLEAEIRRSVRAVDPDVAASSIRTLDDIVTMSLAGRRMNVRVLEVFGQVAIGLAGMGVYAIAAFSAASRKRELAIRSAFGASRQELARLLYREELRPVLLGVGVGMLSALGLSRPLQGGLFQISARDPFTYAIVAALLVAVALVASYVPARRAGLADPVELLRG